MLEELTAEPAALAAEDAAGSPSRGRTVPATASAAVTVAAGDD
jgi:hypothetical protein